MPVADTSTHETTLSGTTRRRTWAHPEVRSHSLVVMTFDRLHVAPLAGPPRPEILSAIEAGQDLDDLLGPLAVVVELNTVRGVKLDLLTNSLLVEYATGRSDTSRLTIVFATPEAADVCYTKLWRRLDNGFRLAPYKRDAWTLARAPLALLVGALVVTAALALTSSVVEDTASARAAAQVSPPSSAGMDRANVSKSSWEIIFGRMNWRVVCALGGAVAAVAQVWLYRRLTRPPVSLELVRS